MPDPNQKSPPGRRLVVSPQEPLVAGGPAEELEHRIQDIFRRGYGHVVLDLRGVPSADSAGIRAFVRGHTTAQRLHRRFTLVAPNAKVRELLKFSLLDTVIETVDSIERGAVASRLVGSRAHRHGHRAGESGPRRVGITWPTLGFDVGPPPPDPGFPVTTAAADMLLPPLFELAKLVAAAMIGMLVTVVHRQYRVERGPNPTMDQAQVLLCIAGALMMIIIGNNVARAFGIAGAASIIRFRTPGRGRARHHDPLHPDGPRHGRRCRRVRGRRARARCSSAR